MKFSETPQGGRIVSMLEHKGYIWVATENRVYKADERGLGWECYIPDGNFHLVKFEQLPEPTVQEPKP